MATLFAHAPFHGSLDMNGLTHQYSDRNDCTNCNFPDQTFLVEFIAEVVEKPGPEVMKLFACSTQLSMKFYMLISIKISRNSACFRFR